MINRTPESIFSVSLLQKSSLKIINKVRIVFIIYLFVPYFVVKNKKEKKPHLPNND